MEFAGSDPIIVPAGEGKVFNVFGETITCKLYSEDTAEAFTMYEVETPPNGGAPLHQHLKEDETCFVLEGEYEVHCGNRRFKVAPRVVFLLPRDVPHTFRNVGKTAGRMLVISAPGGVEKFYEELSQAPPEAVADSSRLKKLARRHHIELLGLSSASPGKPGG
jgi:mannose-6-phosphate isomerase-like protein (cupin superfamily)